MSKIVQKPIFFEMSFMEWLKVIWNRKILIFITTLIFVLLSLFIGFFGPKEFTANSVFISQSGRQGGASSGLGGLAALAGLDLAGISNENLIPPNLYPIISKSVKFKTELIHSIIHPKGSEDGITYAEYYENHFKPSPWGVVRKYTIGLPSLISGKISSIFSKNESNDFLQRSNNDQKVRTITSSEQGHFKRLDSQLKISLNKREGIVSLEFVMHDPKLAAEMALNAQNLLQCEIIDFKIKSSKQQLDYLEERLEEKYQEFEIIRNRLADYRDSNIRITSASAQNEKNDLEARYNLAFDLYSQLSKQVEQAKLKVSMDTPVFTVLQEIYVPKEKSSPKRLQLLILMGFLGVSIGMVIIFLQNIIPLYLRKWRTL